jgi:hypothetical protein
MARFTTFGKSSAVATSPDETFDVTVIKHNGALDGFNQWLLNREAFSMETMKPAFTVREGRHYRFRFRNASDDIHPLHLHRHSFELVRVGSKPTAGVVKDVVMLGGVKKSNSNSSPIILVPRCCAAISNCIWISALWRWSNTHDERRCARYDSLSCRKSRC